MGFNSLNLNPNLVTRATELGFTSPTPIQKKSIPVILKNRDIIGLAQTGTGKTGAFVLPILHQLIDSKGSGNPRVLILAPTRELAEQIHGVTVSFGRAFGIKSTAIFGGVSITKQQRDLERGVDIIVACPGRLLDLVERKSVDLNFIETLVLDEADQMLDMGFFPAINKITKLLPTTRQTLLFSATMPKGIEKLTNRIQHRPVKVQVDRQSVTTQVSHSLYTIQQNRKTDLLQEIIQRENSFSTLVFTRTKHRAKNLAAQLNKLGMKSTSLHGNLSVNQRRNAVEGFKSGKYQILVATDIAARGIDISGISHVINYDVPVTPELYIHRIGRTGRAAETGVAYTFVCNDEMSIIARVEKILKSKLAINEHQYC